jgi:hypothetical protein
MDADIKGYSQWFGGKSNNGADALLRDWNINKDKLTSILRSHFTKQMPENFQILPLPSEISPWLISLLQLLLVSKQLREQHTTMGLVPGGDASNGVSLLDSTISTLTSSVKLSEIFCLEHLQWLSEKDGSWGIALNHWLKEQSAVPSRMWYRSFGNWEDRIPQKTQTTCLASFYHGSSGPTGMMTPKKCNKRPFLSPSLMN